MILKLSFKSFLFISLMFFTELRISVRLLLTGSDAHSEGLGLIRIGILIINHISSYGYSKIN